MLDPININIDNRSFLYFFRMCLLIHQPCSHHVSSVQDESESALVCDESWVDVWVGVDRFEDGHTIIINIDEMEVFVNHNMFYFVVLPCLHFMDSHARLLGEDDLDLVLGKFGPSL